MKNTADLLTLINANIADNSTGLVVSNVVGVI